MTGNSVALRGAVLSFTASPFDSPADTCFRYEPDGLVLVTEGVVTDVGPAAERLQTLPEETELHHYPHGLIMPGMIDCHVHYAQTDIIASYGKQLIDWLNNYTYPAEQRFSDMETARRIARFFLGESLRSGTTTSAVFCTVDAVSVEAFFLESEALNMRNIAGKVLMDRNAPKALLDTPQSSVDESQALIDRWHGRGRAMYAVSPRFAPTSSAEQMELTGQLWQANPGTFLQSHVSENLGEIEWVKELYPERLNYVDVYHHYGQLGERAILGHGLHLSESEFQVLHDTGTAIAHCPTSNLFLGSGLFDFERALAAHRPVRIGLATDLGAGTSFSQLVTMSEAYKVGQLGGYSLSALQAFFLATRGAAEALYLDDVIGSLEAGYEADMVVFDLAGTALLEHRQAQAESIEDVLFLLMMLGDDRSVEATYIAGNRVYNKADGATLQYAV